MPNPVRAARKAGRQNLRDVKQNIKDVKQNVRAEKITKKFEAKADKIGMKTRAAGAAAKSAAQAKAGVRPSTVSKIEPLKKNLQIPTTPLKFELAKPSASAVAAKEAAFKPTPKAAAPKKTTTTKKKTTPKATGPNVYLTGTTGATPYLTGGKDLPTFVKPKTTAPAKAATTTASTKAATPIPPKTKGQAGVDADAKYEKAYKEYEAAKAEYTKAYQNAKGYSQQGVAPGKRQRDTPEQKAEKWKASDAASAKMKKLEEEKIRLFIEAKKINNRKKGGSVTTYNMGRSMKSSYMSGGSIKSKKK